METQALNYLKQMLDKAVQKGAFNLNEVANIIASIDALEKKETGIGAIVVKDKK